VSAAKGIDHAPVFMIIALRMLGGFRPSSKARSPWKMYISGDISP
jgi:hypothetical protein